MTMDNKENKKKWSNESDKSLLKGSSKGQKNGGAYSTSNGNNCAEKETMFKNEIVECAEERYTCGLGPCSPKWLQVRLLVSCADEKRNKP